MALAPGSWPDHVIWWHLHPLGFLGAEHQALPPGSPPRHRLRHLVPWLDELIELGCNGLLLGPVFRSQTHGYDTVDHLSVDPRLGTGDDLVDLLSAAHERGIRVLLDGVFNHVGRDFPAFRDVLDHGTGSAYASWFVPVPGATQPAYATFEGHDALVELNHREPAVADYVVDVMDRWLSAGADGWRLDAAYAVPLPFWRDVADRVRRRHPDAWLLAEVIHGDYAAFVTEGGLDSVTQYELWKAIWSSLNDRNLFELAWALERHDAYTATFAPQTFVGNHDVTRLASRLANARDIGPALAVLMTVAGVPSVYAGDERGFRGVKEEREGGDDAIRPAFPASPADLGTDPQGLRPLHQQLIGVRRRHPWLVRGQTSVLALANAQIAFETAAEGHRLITLVNLDDAPVSMDLPGLDGVLSDAASIPGAGADLLVVPPHGWRVLEHRRR